MKLNLYAVKDKCANALIRFAFGSNDSSFCRDNVRQDLLSEQNPRGLPFKDLQYILIGRVDTESFVVEPVSHEILDIEHCYQFKVENDISKDKE